MKKKTKKDQLKALRKATQKGGVLLRGTRTHADKKNPSPQKIRKAPMCPDCGFEYTECECL